MQLKVRGVLLAKKLLGSSEAIKKRKDVYLYNYVLYWVKIDTLLVLQYCYVYCQPIPDSVSDIREN